MKGQIFIVVSLFVAIALFALAMNMQVIPEPQDYLQNHFINLRTELTETASYAVLDSEDVSAALDEYILFSNTVLSAKGYTQTIYYTEDSGLITIDIYLGKGDEYYKDKIIIDTGVYI